MLIALYLGFQRCLLKESMDTILSIPLFPAFHATSASSNKIFNTRTKINVNKADEAWHNIMFISR